MQREACRDSIDVFLRIRDTYPEIRQFFFALYRKRPRARERAVGWHGGGNIGELFCTNTDEVYFARRRSVSREELIELVRACDVGTSLGLFSKVKRGGREQHLALLDLSGKRGADVAKRAFTQAVFAQPHGFILASRNGLHCIGTRLLAPEEFPVFCGNALLAGDLADKRYLGYSLQGGQFCLRLAAKIGEDALHIPEVLRTW